MKFKVFLVAAILVILSSVSVMAQVENPCGGSGDPDDPTTCPLDSWVMVLVAAAIVFVTIQLHRQQESKLPG